MRKTIVIMIISCAIVLADIAPWEDFEGSYTVNYTNLATGETREMDIDFGDCRRRDYVYTNWVYDGWNPSEGFGVLKSGWIAAADTADGGSVGIYKKQGPDCITGISLRLSDSTLHTWVSEGAKPLQLEPAWARAIFGGYGVEEEYETDYRFRITLDGTDSLWSAKLAFKDDGYEKITEGCGLSVGTAIAVLFPMADTFHLKFFVAGEYFLEGRWISVYYDEDGKEIITTGSEELDFRSNLEAE
jgi:hypothetical protein